VTLEDHRWCGLLACFLIPPPFHSLCLTKPPESIAGARKRATAPSCPTTDNLLAAQAVCQSASTSALTAIQKLQADLSLCNAANISTLTTRLQTLDNSVSACFNCFCCCCCCCCCWCWCAFSALLRFRHSSSPPSFSPRQYVTCPGSGSGCPALGPTGPTGPQVRS
jgi:hypothetical protein